MPLLRSIFLVASMFIRHLVCGMPNTVEDAALNWLLENGGSCKGVSISHFEGMGRGFLATRNIREGDEILKVPSKLIISVSTAQTSADIVHRKMAKMFKNQDQAVIGVLVYEKLKGNQSLWAPYFEILPAYVPNFAFSGFSPSEFQDSRLEDEAAGTLARLRLDFAAFRKTSKASWPESVPPPTFELYQWASAIIDSRALRFEGQVKLIPFADIFNYAPHPVLRRKNGGNFFLQHHKLNEKGLAVTSDRDCQKGFQLFEDYGDNDDTIYAQFHGFVANENPFRCFEMKADYSNDMLGKPEALKRLFKALKINSNMRKCVDAAGDVGLGLIVYESALSFNDAEIAHCEAAIREYKSDWNEIFNACGFSEVQGGLYEYLNRPVQGTSDEYENSDVDESSLFFRAVLGIRDRLTAHVSSLPTSLSYDRAALKKAVYDVELLLEETDSSSVAQRKELERLKMSLQFRIASKTHLQHLCCLYRASCCLLKRSGGIVSDNEKLEDRGSSRAADPSLAGRHREIDWKNASLEDKLYRFSEWFESANPPINKLKATLIPGFRIGTIANSSISAGEIYLTVPTKLIMDSSKARESGSGVSSLLQQLSAKYNNQDHFHELLFFLLYEYFAGGPDSYFWPYLALLPRPEDMDIPLMWSSNEEVFEKLRPSVVRLSSEVYRNSVRVSYEKITKIGAIRKFFGMDAPGDDGVIGAATILTFENYKWATAILDSRSIWWNGERHLVPLLDFVNCAQGPPSHQVHSTSLNDDGSHAITKAGWNFTAGEQVFEQYGQPNYIYFMYHGFVLPENSFDCISFDIQMTKEEVTAIDWASNRAILQKLGLRDPTAVFHTCLKETVPESIWVYLALKVNIIDEMRKTGQLGEPHSETIRALLEIINSRLKEYIDFFRTMGSLVGVDGLATDLSSISGGSNIQFLKSEFRLLVRLKDNLVNLAKGFKSEL